jgi:segregation and condensation protein B
MNSVALGLDGDPEEASSPLALRIAEAILFASAEPVAAATVAASLPEGADVDGILLALQARYAGRGVNLVPVGGCWAFRTADDLAYLFNREESAPRKLSRAALEVLAIIAYHQPVTRAEIEEVRGVETSKGTLDLLLETQWIRMRGRRQTPGRPVTYGTTPRFLDQFGLKELRDLPDLEELKGAGLLSPRMPAGFSVPLPPRDADEPSADEDPLADIDLEELGLLPPRDRDA